jgi:CRISPR-associated endonuclease/helicase Cas3
MRIHQLCFAPQRNATQPVLDNLPKSEKGQLALANKTELIGESNKVKQLFDDLKRVNIVNQVRPSGWSTEEITDYAMSELDASGSCLIIVNTKAWAQALYETCAQTVDKESIYHLSTSMCPLHRKHILDKVRKRLDAELPVLCISTQLIEAGVDIDFGSVIRFLAGLDSIAQAAGRCNRNGRLDTGRVTVLNPEDENIDLLEEIKIGQEKARRIFDEFPEGGLLNPETMQQYFDYYFFQRADQMVYPVTKPREDNLLNMLSCNENNPSLSDNRIKLKQSFMAAGRLFKAIEAPTHAVIVPYENKGKKIIAELCGMAKEFNPGRYYALIKQAQQYSVNLFPNIWDKLRQADAVHETQDGEGVYFLDTKYYSDEFGVCTEKVNTMPSQIL